MRHLTSYILFAGFLTFTSLHIQAAEARKQTLLEVPGTWEEQADGLFAEYDGYAWYRCFVKVPDKWADMKARPLWRDSVSLIVDKVADAHEVYINGTKIGSIGSFPPKFKSGLNDYQRYKVPPGLLKKGKYNTIAIRIYNKEESGGFRGPAPIIAGYFLECRLKGKWQFVKGDDPEWTVKSITTKPKAAAYDQFTPATSTLGRATKTSPGRRLPPEKSLQLMKTPTELVVDQILTEPIVGQPLFINFDARGRMWVVQYRQYPYPAGLKVLSRNKYYRMEFDKVSPPPPNHFKGKDRISIHEDTNGDGKYDKHKIFAGDLNIATSVAHGRGGHWVLNPPYLMFYPDKNKDDIPDADPVVHLRGFGLSDTHSAPNSLRWGTDGWLYMMQGSNVVSHLKTTEDPKEVPLYCEGPAVWRYHPETKRAELFAEGGGNAFGMEIDAQGRLYSGHNGANTRGFYYVQGGYYEKGTDRKYGGVTNPYAFGLLPFMSSYTEVTRFSHTFVKYEGHTLPQEYQQKFMSVDPLHQNVVVSDVKPNGASFKTADVGFALESDDFGFRPVEIKVGPDGAVYVADFYEEFIAHGQHYQGQIDPDSGRIYRLRAKGSKFQKPIQLDSLKTTELVALLKHPNKWHRRTALRLIADRRENEMIPELKQSLFSQTDQQALEAFWALNLVGGFNEELAKKTLNHANPFVRLWTVRLLGDAGDCSSSLGNQLALLARQEKNSEVRSQLASSARRFPGAICLPIVSGLVTHDEDANDPQLPLLIWWALESKTDSNRELVMSLFKEESIWNQTIVKQTILGRMMRRFAITGSRNNLISCAQLLEMAPDKAARDFLMKGFELAFKGRSLAKLPVRLAKALSDAGGGSTTLQMRLGNKQAIQLAIAALESTKTKPAQQMEYVQVLGELQEQQALKSMQKLLAVTKNVELQKELLTALQYFKQPEIAKTVLLVYAKLSPEVQEVAQTLLVSRKTWTLAFLQAVEKKLIVAETIPGDVVRKMTVHRDQQIAQLVKKHWKDQQGATSEQMQAQIAKVMRTLKTGKSDPYAGKKLYMTSCGKCHKLFGEGNRIGPELTQYKRDDTLRVVLNIVNPSAEIREGYELYQILDLDGRVVSGFRFDEDQNVVVLRGADGQNITVKRDDIDEMLKQPRSLMPEGQLDKLTEQQLRDLFAFIRSSQPVH